MSKRLIIAILILTVGGLLIGFLLYFLKSKVAPSVPPVTVKTAPVAAVPALPSAPGRSSLTPPEPLTTAAEQNAWLGRDAARRLAVVFTERFGSYSSQSQLANVSDLYPMMTESLKTWSAKYADDLLKSFSSDKYYGVTTKVLSSTFKSYDDQAGAAEMIIITQREESQEAGAAAFTVYYQQFDLSLKRDNNVWKVDTAYWQKK